MKKKLRIAATFLGLLSVALVGYEGAAVLQSQAATDGIFAEQLKQENIDVPLSSVSAQRIRSLLLVQDPNFYQHRGIDLTTRGAGLTTITQAMVKYLYFENYSPGFMKIEQSLIARFALSPKVSKDDQLTVFINTVYLGTIGGKDVRGFGEAARVYYDKPFADLSQDEYLSIVAMLVAPRTFNVKYAPRQNQERVRRIKLLISGAYEPEGLTDVLYGQEA